MAVWSKALPLTASCLSQLPGFKSWWPCEKVASDLWLDGGFPLVFPVSSTSYNWQVTPKPPYGRKSDEKSNFQIPVFDTSQVASSCA